MIICNKSLKRPHLSHGFKFRCHLQTWKIERSFLHHALPYHTVPYSTVPYHTILYHTIPYHTILYHTTPYHSFANLQNRAVIPACSVNTTIRDAPTWKYKEKSFPYKSQISLGNLTERKKPQKRKSRLRACKLNIWLLLKKQNNRWIWNNFMFKRRCSKVC